MSVASCRNDVANAEALFVTHLARTRHEVGRLVGEVRGAATPMRLAVGAVATGAVLYVAKPRVGLLLRLPLWIAAASRLLQHFAPQAAQHVSWVPGPDPGPTQ